MSVKVENVKKENIDEPNVHNEQMSFKDWKTFKAALTKSETEKPAAASPTKTINGKKFDKHSNGRYNEVNNSNNKFGNSYNTNNKGPDWNRGKCNYNSKCFAPPIYHGPNLFYINPHIYNAFGVNLYDNMNNIYKHPIYNSKFHSNSHNQYPKNFFSKDGMYRQRDNMQKPLNHYDSFRGSTNCDRNIDNTNNKSSHKPQKSKGNSTNIKSKQQQIGNEESLEFAKRKDIDSKTNDSGQKYEPPKMTPPPAPPLSLISEPKIFIKNPKPNTTKPYIPLPRAPDENSELTPGERKKQWKEYREAMKPFKNREFYNAKRVVQRLGKKDPNELEEKEKLRLAKAQETMAAHKLRLSQKYAPYVKSTEAQPNSQMGEVYVLKQRTLKYWNTPKPMPEQPYNNCRNFDENVSKVISTLEPNSVISTISTTYDNFPVFVPGGVVEGTIQTLHQN